VWSLAGALVFGDTINGGVRNPNADNAAANSLDGLDALP